MIRGKSFEFVISLRSFLTITCLSVNYGSPALYVCGFVFSRLKATLSSEVVFPQLAVSTGCRPGMSQSLVCRPASNSCTHLDRNTRCSHGCVESENPCRTVVALWSQAKVGFFFSRYTKPHSNILTTTSNPNPTISFNNSCLMTLTDSFMSSVCLKMFVLMLNLA